MTFFRWHIVLNSLLTNHTLTSINGLMHHYVMTLLEGAHHN